MRTIYYPRSVCKSVKFVSPLPRSVCYYKFIFHTVIVSSRSSRHEIWRTPFLFIFLRLPLSVAVKSSAMNYSTDQGRERGAEGGGGRVASVHLLRGLCSDCQRILLFSDGGKALAKSYRETRFERREPSVARVGPPATLTNFYIFLCPDPPDHFFSLLHMK